MPLVGKHICVVIVVNPHQYRIRTLDSRKFGLCTEGNSSRSYVYNYSSVSTAAVTGFQFLLPVLKMVLDESMTAWQIHEYKGVKSLKLVEGIPIPELTTSTDVLVEVKAASLNFLDIRMSGTLYVNIYIIKILIYVHNLYLQMAMEKLLLRLYIARNYLLH